MWSELKFVCYMRQKCNSYICQWFRYFEFRAVSSSKPEVVTFAYNLGHFLLTSIELRRFAAFFFFNSLFLFDFGVIPVFVLNFALSNFGGKLTTNRKYNCRQSTQQRLFSGPLRCWCRVWHMHHTNFISLYMWFLYICAIPVLRISRRI